MCQHVLVCEYETMEVLGVAWQRADLKLNDDSNEWGSNDLGLQRLVLIQTWETESQAGGYRTYTHVHAQTQDKVETHGERIHMWLCALLLCAGNTAQSIKLLHTHCSLFYCILFSGLYTLSRRKLPPLFISMIVWQVCQPAAALFVLYTHDGRKSIFKTLE